MGKLAFWGVLALVALVGMFANESKPDSDGKIWLFDNEGNDDCDCNN